MNKIVVVCRLTSLSLALLGLNMMYNNLLKSDTGKSIFETIFISTVVILVSLVYYIICKCVISFLKGNKQALRHRPKDISYMDMQVSVVFFFLIII